ncbi:DUF421 domain-containing protein [Paenibacillus sp. FSL R10-2736]|uniref:DUF421 domain-containing protein n=1 Tax=Paenibacillus sp. FSL R10-2736 TaxID=2954692 RepID=UPI0030F5B4A4
MHAYMDILVRTIISVILLLFIPKLLGKQMISNMTSHNFVTSIMLGSIAANLAFNESLKSVYLILALVAVAALSFLLSLIALKSHKWRAWISGSPTVLIEGGKILEGNMRKLKYTMDSLDQSLREKDIFDIEEVEYAILEDNGRLSVLKKEAFQGVQKKDMKLPSHPQAFPVELIMDGIVMEDNLKNYGLTAQWLENELRRQGKRISDVFYAVKGTQQQLIFDFYKDDIRHPLDEE